MNSSPWYRHIRKLRRVAVEFNRARLEIEPWLIGYMIGDGCMLHGQLSITDEPGACIDHAETLILNSGHVTRLCKRAGSKAVSLFIKRGDKRGNCTMISMLGNLGLYGKRAGEKFIPHRYLTADRSQRLDLLAGLLDSDGHFTGAYYDWISKSSALADDFVFLARSLGFCCKVTESWKMCQTFDNPRRYFRVSIYGDLSILNGHSIKIPAHPPRRQVKSHLVTGFKTRSVGIGNYFGFELDGDHLYLDGGFTVHHNSGKSVIGAELCRSIIASAGGPAARPTTALSITHTRELIRQNAECFARYTAAHESSGGAPLRHGIYSAGLGEKHLDAPMTFAGVQSYCRIEAPPQPALILIDEVHRCPRESDTQYGQVLTGAPHAARCGLTATPYRLDSGLLIDGDDAWFDTLLPVVSTADLQAAGTLSQLTGVVSRDAVSTAGVKVRAGEFVTSELEEVACDPVCVDRICRGILTHAEVRHSILVFAVSVAHAEALALRLRDLKCLADVIHGGLDADTRDDRLTAFRTGRLRVLVNCMILTTGFDYPGIDCIAVVRPTMSLSLWVQMVGRGLRTAEGKTDCQILDFGGNWARHGRSLDGLPPESVKDEPLQDQRAREEQARSAPLAKTYHFGLDGEVDDTHETRVVDVLVRCEANRKKPALSQLRVTYLTDMGAINIWLLPEHGYGPRLHAARWFARRGIGSVPRTAHAAHALAMAAPLPESISVRRDGDFWRVVVEHFAT